MKVYIDSAGCLDHDRYQRERVKHGNFSPHTIRGYIRTVRDFAAYFHKPTDQLDVEEVRQSQLHMLRDQKLATGTVQTRMTALRFFFKKVLKRHDPELYDMALTRRPKKLPVVLSPEEVEKLIEAAPNAHCSGNRLRGFAIRNKKPPARAGGSCSNSRVPLTG